MKMAVIFLSFVSLFAWLVIDCERAIAQDEVASFNEISGEVVDSSGQPIESFKVTVTIYNYSNGFGKAPETSKVWEGEFTDGKFLFEVDEPIPMEERVYLSRRVSAEGYVSNDRNSFQNLRTFNGKYSKLEMWRAVTISGKLVMPDSQADESPVGARVNLTSKSKGLLPNYNNMFRRVAAVSSDGSFKAVVPENSKMIIVASAENAAANRKEIKIGKFADVDGKQDVGEIKLEEGVRISGTVVSQDGNPVGGQVVRIMQTAANSGYMAESVSGYAVTDADGKFTLPPRIGKSKLTLVEVGTIDGKTVKVTGKKLSAKPVELTLAKGTPPPEVEIRASKMWTVHGFVNTELAGGNESISAYTSVSGEAQRKVELDGNGRFEFETPDGVEFRFTIYSNAGGERWVAQMAPDSVKKNSQYFVRSPATESNFFHLKAIDCDIGPIEFSMVKPLPDERTVSESILEWLIYGD